LAAFQAIHTNLLILDVGTAEVVCDRASLYNLPNYKDDEEHNDCHNCAMPDNTIKMLLVLEFQSRF
jgi:hypothetical protein